MNERDEETKKRRRHTKKGNEEQQNACAQHYLFILGNGFCFVCFYLSHEHGQSNVCNMGSCFFFVPLKKQVENKSKHGIEMVRRIESPSRAEMRAQKSKKTREQPMQLQAFPIIPFNISSRPINQPTIRYKIDNKVSLSPVPFAFIVCLCSTFMLLTCRFFSVVFYFVCVFVCVSVCVSNEESLSFTHPVTRVHTRRSSQFQFQPKFGINIRWNSLSTYLQFIDSSIDQCLLFCWCSFQYIMMQHLFHTTKCYLHRAFGKEFLRENEKKTSQRNTA